jgi:hypothetical protein
MGAVAEMPGLRCWAEEKANAFADARLAEDCIALGTNGCPRVLEAVVGRLIP